MKNNSQKTQELLNVLLNSKTIEAKELQNVMWELISASLLLSENLLKNDNLYSKINENQTTMIINILEKTMSDYDYENLDSFFLDDNNNIVNPFHNLVKDELVRKYLIDNEEYEQYIMTGSNSGITTDSFLDYKKLIIRIRNSLAHSNYEIIDDNYIRLFHYNNDNKLDFNAKIHKVIILTIIDELNQLVDSLYEPFLNDYYMKEQDILYTTHDISDEEIIQELLQYQIFTADQIKNTINIAKQNTKFYPDYRKDNNFDKISIIYELLYEQIKPICDYGIIVNEIIFENIQNDKTMNYYFYEKYGYYNYFNSDIFIKESKSIEENKYKLILFTYLHLVLLKKFNEQNIDYTIIDFSKMDISEDIKEQYIELKRKSINKDFQLLNKQESELLKIASSIKKLKSQQHNAKEANKYIKEVLPERIRTLQERYKLSYQKYLLLKQQTQSKLYDKLFEIADLQANVNISHQLAFFVINHIRNSLAHGYLSFPEGFSLDNPLQTIIEFKDYEKNNRHRLTFKGSIKVADLLEILNYKNNISETEKNNKKI